MEKSYSSWPLFGNDEIASVANVLQSGKVNYWTGDICKQFESRFSTEMGAEYGIAVANGTLALELALRAIELQHGDEVIVPARTFIATASSVAICGGIPIVADIDERSQNITAQTIKPLISSKTKAIIVVHLSGIVCDMDPILSLAEQHNLIVIEDCAQSHGASYKNRKVGSIGHLAAFSFCQDKIMTTGGEGGMLLTSNKDYYDRAASFKDHGKNFKKLEQVKHEQKTYQWLHDSFGSNFRMTEMQAAIGLAQLTKLNDWLQKRQELASTYSDILSEIKEKADMILPEMSGGHVYYKYCFQVLHPKFNAALRDEVIFELRKKGIPIFLGFSPDISLELAFEKFHQEDHPIAKLTASRMLMLLCHPTLEKDEVAEIAEAVSETIKRKL